MTNKVKSMYRRHNENREELGTFRKGYEINREKRIRTDVTDLKEDICSLLAS